MTTTKLNTIEMTRRIRDALYEQMKDKTRAERLAFYRDTAQVVHQRLGLPPPTSALVEPYPLPSSIVKDEDQRS